MGDVALEDLDIPTLVMLTGEAVRDRVTEQMHAAGFADIRPAHGFVFQHLIDRSPTVGELAEQLGMTQQGASKLVVELESLGYVSRNSDPADHRVRRILLTERGTACITAARRARAEWQAALAERLGEPGIATLATGLAAFAEELGIEETVRHRQVKLPPHER
ncbi:MarR family winged helix-turn-helix transcriptional regulator [Nocardia xishanensis]